MLKSIFCMMDRGAYNVNNDYIFDRSETLITGIKYKCNLTMFIYQQPLITKINLFSYFNSNKNDTNYYIIIHIIFKNSLNLRAIQHNKKILGTFTLLFCLQIISNTKSFISCVQYLKIYRYIRFCTANFLHTYLRVKISRFSHVYEM